MSVTLWERLCRGARRVRERADWSTVVGADWADRVMDVAVTDRFHAKQGRSTGRWVLHAAGRRLGVYLKRHYVLPRWQGLWTVFRPHAGLSPALTEWHNLEWARSQGLPVPEPVAAAEFLNPWGRLQSVLAVEELTGMIPLHEAIPTAATSLSGPDFARWKRGLTAEVARLCSALHDRRRFHKDLYLCHFYVAADDCDRVPEWGGRVHMIDLHRLGHHPWAWPAWLVKDLAQLLYSTWDVAGVTARDRVRFWRAYQWQRHSGPAARLLRRAILLKCGAYRRHNRKRPAVPLAGPGARLRTGGQP
jgi:heptose I phosphotransferase